MALGETVKLNSGGPVMTVVAISKRGACLCAWFTDALELREQWFAPAALHLAKV